MDTEEVKSVLAEYLEHAEMLGQVRTEARIPPCRDADDRAFLRLAYAAKADALVTGDGDLLAVAPPSRIPVLAPDALKQKL